MKRFMPFTIVTLTSFRSRKDSSTIYTVGRFSPETPQGAWVGIKALRLGEASVVGNIEYMKLIYATILVFVRQVLQYRTAKLALTRLFST